MTRTGSLGTIQDIFFGKGFYQLRKCFFSGKYSLLICLFCFVNCELIGQDEAKKRYQIIAGISGLYSQQNNYIPESYSHFTNPTQYHSTFRFNSKFINFSILPYIGYEFSEKWAVGVRFRFNREKETFQYNSFSDSSVVNSTKKLNLYDGGLWARYIFNPNKKILFYGQANANLLHAANIDIVSGPFPIKKKITNTFFHHGIDFGALYQINERIRLKINYGLFEILFENVYESDFIDHPEFYDINVELDYKRLQFGIEFKL